jgi:hypothetical protein
MRLCASQRTEIRGRLGRRFGNRRSSPRSQVQLGNEVKEVAGAYERKSPPMLSLIIVDHEAGVNDAGNPAEQR